MQEVLKWLATLYGRSFTFGDLLTIVGFIGSIIGAIVAAIKSIAARKSEKKSEEYAKNANRYYLETQKYYESIEPIVENQKKRIDEQEKYTAIKGRAYEYLSRLSKDEKSGIWLTVLYEDVFEKTGEPIHIVKQAVESLERERFIKIERAGTIVDGELWIIRVLS